MDTNMLNYNDYKPGSGNIAVGELKLSDTDLS